MVEKSGPKKHGGIEAPLGDLSSQATTTGGTSGAKKTSTPAPALDAQGVGRNPGLAATKKEQAATGLAGLKPDLNIKFEDLVPAKAGPTGSNPGGWFQDPKTGQQYYVKVPRTGNEDIVDNEVLSSKLYELAGVEVPQLTKVTVTGKLGYQEFKGQAGLASKIISGLKEGSSQLTGADVRNIEGVFSGFGADIWLANWDVAGLTFDNMLLGQGSEEGKKKGVRIEVGGACLYRAQGKPKGIEGRPPFGHEVVELANMRNPNVAREAAQIFKHMTDEEVAQSILSVVKIKNEDITAVVNKYGFKDQKKNDDLIETLIARKSYLAGWLQGKFPDLAKLAAEPTTLVGVMAAQNKKAGSNEEVQAP
jgi:hypothetical protein